LQPGGREFDPPQVHQSSQAFKRHFWFSVYSSVDRNEDAESSAQGLEIADREQKIQLIFIIISADFPLETNINVPLKEAVARALADSWDAFRPPAE
jgi:hypothetical protein